MEYLPGGIALELPQGCFPLSTDSMVLAHFAKLPKRARVLDLGSGCGTLGMLLCSREESCHVTGVELTACAHQAACANIRRNGLGERMVSICADVRSVSRMFSPGSFSVCLSNPPYYPAGSAAGGDPLSRREDSCPPEELFSAAAWALKYGGDFYLVHKPERLAELIALASPLRLEAKELLLLRHREGGAVSLIALRFRKGGKPGLQWQEQALFCADGTPTDFYCQVYHTED